MESSAPFRQAFLDEGAFQCGYCTSGMILGATSLLHEQHHPTEEQILEAMEGHICRCGTYPRIVDAVKRASRLLAQGQANEHRNAPTTEFAPSISPARSGTSGLDRRDFLKVLVVGC